MKDKVSIMRAIICRAMYVITPCVLRLVPMKNAGFYTVECVASEIDVVTSRWCVTVADLKVIYDCFAILDVHSSIHSRDWWLKMYEEALAMEGGTHD